MLSLGILLPLVLRELPSAEVSLWLLFAAITSFFALADFGFSSTFIRSIAYARAPIDFPGAYLGRESISGLNRPKHSVSDVVMAMTFIYHRLGILTFLIGGLAGTIALIRPISEIHNHLEGWVSWIIVLTGASMNIFFCAYSVYLQGAEKIAVYRRVDIALGIIAALISSFTVVNGGGLLGLVFSTQFGVLASLFIYRWIATHSVNDKHVWSIRRRLNRELWGYIWAPAWRSGLGILLTFGTIQGSAILYAQFAPPVQVASYLLAVRLMQGLVSLGNVPFYTKLPTLARFYAAGRMSELVAIARSGMSLANWILLLGILLIGFFGQEVLRAIGSNTQIIHGAIWWVLGLAYMAERIGAMHLQLYTTTNHSVWHIANGISGLLMLCLMPLLYGSYGVIGLPLGMLLGYLCFYLPYSITISYRAFKMHLSRQEFTGIFLPVAILFLALIISIY